MTDERSAAYDILSAELAKRQLRRTALIAIAGILVLALGAIVGQLLGYR